MPHAERWRRTGRDGGGYRNIEGFNDRDTVHGLCSDLVSCLEVFLK